jgi:hypothetical protein
MISNKSIIIISMFFILFAVNVIVILKFVFKNPFTEHFTENENPEKEGLKTFIFKLFDEKYQKNPSQEELDLYMAMNTKEEIEKAINGEKTINNETETETVTENGTEKENESISHESKIEEKNKTIMQNAITNTLNTIETMNNNVTFSKTFIDKKLKVIQQQIDDIKLLLI